MKKQLIAIGIAAAVLVGLIVTFGISLGPARVQFKAVSKEEIPREIEAEIIPQYRDLERALACKVGQDVYVIVTRGAKPTAGFEAAVSKMELKSKENKSILVVHGTFADPENGEQLAQVICYPYAVVKTELTGLPDEIELKVDYAK